MLENDQKRFIIQITKIKELYDRGIYSFTEFSESKKLEINKFQYQNIDNAENFLLSLTELLNNGTLLIEEITVIKDKLRNVEKLPTRTMESGEEVSGTLEKVEIEEKKEVDYSQLSESQDKPQNYNKYCQESGQIFPHVTQSQTQSTVPSYEQRTTHIMVDGAYNVPTVVRKESGKRRKYVFIIMVGFAVLFILFILLVILIRQINKESDDKTTLYKKETTETKSSYKEEKKKETPVSTSKPLSVVRGFIEDLGKGDFYSAYQKQQNKNWGSYEFFSSVKSYGGISSTSINEINIVNEGNYEATVYVDYYSYDPYNKDGRYKQNFDLKKFGDNWKIVKVKNIEIKQWKN